LTDSRSEHERQFTPSNARLRAPRNATNLNPAIAPAAPRASRPKRAAAAPQISCDDCYFHQNDLCALDKAKPCPTFRAAADNLKAPQQLSFVFRQERTRSAWVFAQPR
jgi:hypothetical protein